MTRITFTEGLAIIVGTEIGGGVLGLPYAAATVGLIPALLILAVATLIMLFTSLIILNLTAEMNGAHFSTIAQSYLGKKGGWIMYLSLFIVVFGALLAYIDGMGDVLAELFGIPQIAGACIFWFLSSIIAYLGLEASGKAEWILTLAMIILFAVIVIMLLPHQDMKNFKGFSVNPDGILTMFGVAIFALLSQIVIPHVYIGIGSYEATKKIIILAYIIPTVIYAAFATTFILAFGDNTPQIATEGLRILYGSTGNIIGNLIPFLALTTSYLGNALANQSNTEVFLNFKKPYAWALTTVPPLAVYLAGFHNFADAVALAGDTGALIAFVILPIIILIAKNRQER